MQLFEPDIILTVLAVALIFVFGGITKGALGFGLPLMTMAMLPFVIPVQAALAINAVVLPLTNVIQFVQARQMAPTIRRFYPVLAGVVVGVPLGAALVSVVSENALTAALGGFVVFFSVLSLAMPQLELPAARERSIGSWVGLVAGIVGALTTVNGPFFVMYLLGLRAERTLFLSAISLFFIVSGALIAGAFWLAGLFDQTRLALATVSLLAAMLGMYLGNRLAAQIPARQFRVMVLVVLCVLGLNLLWRGLNS